MRSFSGVLRLCFRWRNRHWMNFAWRRHINGAQTQPYAKYSYINSSRFASMSLNLILSRSLRDIISQGQIMKPTQTIFHYFGFKTKIHISIQSTHEVIKNGNRIKIIVPNAVSVEANSDLAATILMIRILCAAYGNNPIIYIFFFDFQPPNDMNE